MQASCYNIVSVGTIKLCPVPVPCPLAVPCTRTSSLAPVLRTRTLSLAPAPALEPYLRALLLDFDKVIVAVTKVIHDTDMCVRLCAARLSCWQ